MVTKGNARKNALIQKKIERHSTKERKLSP